MYISATKFQGNVFGLYLNR